MMSDADRDYFRQMGQNEGRALIAADREEARKAFVAWRALLKLGTVRLEADRLKAEGFCEVAAAEFPGL